MILNRLNGHTLHGMMVLWCSMSISSSPRQPLIINTVLLSQQIGHPLFYSSARLRNPFISQSSSHIVAVR